jgi:hypothetical protein
MRLKTPVFWHPSNPTKFAPSFAALVLGQNSIALPPMSIQSIGEKFSHLGLRCGRLVANILTRSLRSEFAGSQTIQELSNA